MNWPKKDNMLLFFCVLYISGKKSPPFLLFLFSYCCPGLIYVAQISKIVTKFILKRISRKIFAYSLFHFSLSQVSPECSMSLQQVGCIFLFMTGKLMKHVHYSPGPMCRRTHESLVYWITSNFLTDRRLRRICSIFVRRQHLGPLLPVKNVFP